MKPCALCSTPFETVRQPFRAEAIYCSTRCRIQALHRERQHAAVVKATRARVAKAAAVAPPSVRCAYCSEWFTPKGGKRGQKYCTRPCAYKATKSSFNARREEHA